MQVFSSLVQGVLALPWLALLGWLLAAAATVSVAPQLVRVCRTRSVEGVSVVTAAAAAATMGCWVVWTLQLGDMPALASSLGPLAVWLGVLAGVLWLDSAWRALLAITASMLVVVLAQLCGVTAALAVTGSVVWVLPQLRTIRRVSSAAGVSHTAYMLLFWENLGWIVYAFGTGHYAYAIAPLVQAPASLLIAQRAKKLHRAVGP